MITEMISALSFIVMFLSGRDVWCVLSVIILTVPGLLAPLGVCGAPRQCPPGGRYFDKHLGPRGRFACCSELCEPPGLFQDQCSKKCPNYEEDKARDTKTTIATPSDPSIGHVIDSPPDNDNTNPSSLTLYILIPVAVLLLLIALIALFLRVRDRGWGGLLPTISPQRAAPGVRYDGGNVVLPGNTPPPRTPAEDGEVRQNPLDNPQPEDDDVRRKLLADPQPLERAQDAEGRFPEGGSYGGDPVGGACGGPARGGQFCQTAKEDAPPIQVQEQGQVADQAVAICCSS